MNRSRRLRRTWLLGLVLIAAGSPARADLSWTVSLDTSQLASHYTGPFGLDFELVGSNGNTVTLTDFSFGGGAAGPGPAFVSGGVGGDLTGGVTLDDSSSFFSDFNQQFTTGGTLSFTVSTSLNSGSFPDSFSMVIFQQYDAAHGYDPFAGTGGTPIATADPSGADSFVTVAINGAEATTAVGYSSAAGDVSNTVTASVVPEPSGGMTMLFGLLGLAGALARRRKAVR
jgi:MYXO-CTERM domain-containing protein